MGDVVFAPFYEVLKRRGVRFEFFHRLENVKLARRRGSGDGEPPYVESARVRRAGGVAGAARASIPARWSTCAACPAGRREPDWRQLADGERLRAARGGTSNRTGIAAGAARKALRVGEDFDFVVLGVGLGAIPYVCREIVARDPRWRAMVDHVKTVATQAFQLWMRADMKELGWPDAPITLSGFVEPFDTWADMSHLVREETWPRTPSRSSPTSAACCPTPRRRRTDVTRLPGAAASAVRGQRRPLPRTRHRHLWPRRGRRAGRVPLGPPRGPRRRRRGGLPADDGLASTRSSGRPT